MIVTNSHGVRVNKEVVTLKCGEREVKMTDLHNNGAVEIFLDGRKLYIEWEEDGTIIYMHYDGREWCEDDSC